MNVAGRIKVAFLGSKEERSILIRDGAKIVQNAVLASPKLSEMEVETFAALKNVQENVLREIARSRRFMKNYIVVKKPGQQPQAPAGCYAY
jgi:transposase-like protein